MSGNRPCVGHRVAFFVIAALTATSAFAQTTFKIDLHAQDLDGALREVGRQTHTNIIFEPGVVTGLKATTLRADLTIDDALVALLKGTGLSALRTSADTVVVKRSGAPLSNGSTPAAGSKASATSSAQNSALQPSSDSQAAEVPTPPPGATDNTTESADSTATVRMDTVEITGSHIKGAPPASPVITISQEQAIEAGQTNLGDVIRSIPQNFSGGQNPGVGSNGGGSVNNYNITGGSALNLRGLGSDATLTLLNGHRLAYDGFSQGVDISQIPLEALDRLEIVADGASAVYGSDAVGGVANVILKRDYDGLAASARVGQATSGGDFQQQYGLVGGTTWSGGGFIAAVDFENDTDVTAQQRDYTSYLPSPWVLYPTAKSQSAIFSVHQDLGTVATFKMDALYTHRESDDVTNDTVYIYDGDRTTSEYSVSPTVEVHLPVAWTLSANGIYGRDDGHNDQPTYSVGNNVLLEDQSLCYCNSVKGWELDSDGRLFHLPAGDARAALGGGYRENRFDEHNVTTGYTTEGEQHSYFEFGEVYVPVISRELAVPLVNSLSVTGAVRHEQYNIFGAVTTPKLSVIYSPTPELDLDWSWGKSFKVPTLIQQYQADYGYVWNVAQIGGAGYPSNATALMSYGGNPDLKPERATSWTATFNLHPEELPGLQAHASYFHIDYQDRIIEPIPNFAVALSDPQYQSFVNYQPTAAQMQAVIDNAGKNLLNYSGAAYNPNSVVAVINDNNVNIASEKVHGVDVAGSYRFDWGTRSLLLTEDANWLVTEMQDNALSAFYDLAGTVYNPPHWHSRSGVIWKDGPLTLSGFYNFIGGVTNNTQLPNVAGAAMRTVDLVGLYHFRAGPGVLRDTDLSPSIQNVGNSRPPYLKNQYSYDQNYDPTNYSPLGRFIGLSITKQWH